MEKPKFVYLISCNADMTEGRGPMHFTGEAYYGKQLAMDIIDQRPGVMGRKSKWSQEKWGDWQVREVEVK